MQSEKVKTIKCALEKAYQALKSAEMNIENNWLTDAGNRIYYSVFYSVMALAYLNNFKTSKHTELLGWFNKKFIHEEKIFDIKLFEIYKLIYKSRMKFDYVVIEKPLKEDILEDLNNAKFFVDSLSEYINNQLDN